MVAPYAGAWIEMDIVKWLKTKYPVAPYAGAWIEIFTTMLGSAAKAVAPYAGAWIEIVQRQGRPANGESLPTRERGLKCSHQCRSRSA